MTKKRKFKIIGILTENRFFILLSFCVTDFVKLFINVYNTTKLFPGFNNTEKHIYKSLFSLYRKILSNMLLTFFQIQTVFEN